MNDLYYYDFYNDPNSSYRATNEAMQAVCNLYGVTYGGQGDAYATLKDAYNSITGLNLTEAKALMKKACDELVAAGLYTAGAEIKIKIGWAKGALTSDDNKQVTLMNEYINEAIEGSGFGKVTFEAVGNIEDRYGDVPKGEYAVGYGAWGGAALYPFRNFQVYMDPDQYDINEAACWNPKTEKLTLTVAGKEVTMTWQEWSNSMIGNGQFAGADNATKLAITSMLETKYLEKYYRIPLCATTICSMLSYQLNYYTETYNMAYGFGGLRLMTYNYDDAEWAAFVKEQGGKLSYE
jgi:oligopeptide transport system substrate-binding protein